MSDIHSNTKNILVLCIDRDDDIGSKSGVKTPVVGKENCIHAGIKLAIEDPEEADSNSIFAAIKLYDELLSKRHSPEVALVSGSFKRGLEADEKIAYQLQDILQKYKADGAVVVSDGIDDEAVLPIIQNMIPVISVQRVVIKHSRSVEYSYAVLGRYLKSLVYDSRYSKFFLGVPGALLIVGALATIFQIYYGFPSAYAFASVAIVLGVALILRGFDLDKAIRNLAWFTPSSFIKVFSLVAGIMIMLASLQMGYAAIPGGLITDGMTPAQITTNPKIIGYFASGMLTLLWIGLGTIFGGMLLSHWFKGSLRALSDVLRLIVLALFYIPMQQFLFVLVGEGSPLNLITSLLVGLALTLVAATFVLRYYRKKKRAKQLTN